MPLHELLELVASMPEDAVSEDGAARTAALEVAAPEGVDVDDAAPAGDAPSGEEPPAPSLFPALNADPSPINTSDTDEHETCATCGELEDGCDCMVCEHCGCHVENPCSDCDHCHDCCECVHCDRCGGVCDSTCDNDYCDYCCARRCTHGDEGCEEDGENATGGGARPPLRDASNLKPAFHRSKPGPDNPSRRYISCELEIAAADDSTATRAALRAWPGTVAVRDGSLPDTGYEINTAPTSGQAFVANIAALCSALNADGAAVTTACGYHVHVDARDYTYMDLLRLVKVYARIELALFMSVPRSRRSNYYCQPCGSMYLNRGIGAFLAPKAKRKAAWEARKLAVHATYGADVSTVATQNAHKARAAQKYDGARYAALNLHSWFYRGTVELRLAAGTTNAEKVARWAVFFACVLDWCKRHTDADVGTLPTEPWPCLLALCPNAATRTWFAARKRLFA